MAEPLTSIFFHSDAVETEGKDLVGRRSAGQSFLKGYLRTLDAPVVQAVVESSKSGKAFEEVARELGETRPIKINPLRSEEDFRAAGCVFFPSPGYQNFPWVRHRYDPRICSLVGITHTVSTRRVMQGLHRLLSEPVEPWDAIICTSRAVKSVVDTQMLAEVGYYKQRFAARRVPLPEFPVIPLGIETADFTPIDGARARMRAAQGVADDAIVVMSMGRLSVVEKANPVSMMMALEQVAERTGRDIHLWLTGWASRDKEYELHEAAASALCHKVTVRILDGREPDLRRNLWAGADIFSLPSDSIQETFGLVPVEAMAAGLPVVMPDWDGFRDTIIDGETGILVPTRMAAGGMGREVAARFTDGRDGYLQYLTIVQAQVQIDVPAYADAFERLVLNDDLRRDMGAAAARHAKRTLDWSAIVPQYMDLARALEKRRSGSEVTTPGMQGLAINPLQIDPFALYHQYPSIAIDPDTTVTLPEPPAKGFHALMDTLSGRELYDRRLVLEDDLVRFCDCLAENGPLTVRALAQKLELPLTRTASAVLILAKGDIVRLPCPPIRDKNRTTPS